MYLVLLVFGALLVVAGVVLAVPGISLHAHSFDPTIVTPGVVAVIGGAVLFGLGLALRVLHRIEHVLETRPMPRAARSEPAFPGEASELPGAPSRPSIPAKSPSRLRPALETSPTLKPSAGEKRLEEMAAKLSARFESLPEGEETESSPTLNLLEPNASESPSRATGEAGDLNELRAGRRHSGPGTARATPRLDFNARFPTAPDRSKGPAFDSLWPKGPRQSRTPVQSSVPAASVPAADPEQAKEPPADTAAPAATDDAPAILKSGVVDGMAYTLFSDGSIEAELPQGRLRFGSITELRNHIERSA
jgi:hypothetical protein